MMKGKIILALTCAGMLAGCGTDSGLGRLMASTSSSKQGPDEFSVLPTKPLQVPPNYTDLPEPQLGARNLVDPLPEHDAVAALGGSPDRLDSDRVGAGEGALLTAAQRNGTAGNIRTVLAEEDEDFRRENKPRLLERLFGTDVYFRRYEEQSLEARREAERLRRAGVRTPSVSPGDS